MKEFSLRAGPAEPATRTQDTPSIVCILNGSANSNKAEAYCNEIARHFRSKGCEAKVHIARNGNEIPHLARTAVAQGATIVVAGGGDGTISAVASELVNTQTALGVIPMGTLNHFAKDLGVPLDIERAIDSIIVGETARVDVGSVNGHSFLNNASVGIYPKLVTHREHMQARGMAKWTAFAAALFRALRSYAPQAVTIDSGKLGKVVENVPFVFIGNNQYEISGLQIGQRSRMDSGQLWVYRGAAATRLEIALLAVKSLGGDPAASGLKIFSTEHFTLGTAQARPRVAIDGEVMNLEAPLDFRILKSALAVVVPRESLFAES